MKKQSLRPKLWYLITARQNRKRPTNIDVHYDLIGCSIRELQTHLLKPFPVGSDLFELLKIYQIDHIEPCSNFDLTDPEEQKKCYHYSNLQLLSPKENMKKGTYFVEDYCPNCGWKLWR